MKVYMATFRRWTRSVALRVLVVLPPQETCKPVTPTANGKLGVFTNLKAFAYRRSFLLHCK